MADINSIQPAGNSGNFESGHTGKSDKSSPGPSFSDVLNNTKMASVTGQSGETSRLDTPNPPAYIGPVDKADGTQETIQRSTKEFFRLFDALHNMLGDTQSSMKDIASLIHSLEHYQNLLTNDIKSLPEGNPGKNILEEMAVMVTTESAKFHRGEYI